MAANRQADCMHGADSTDSSNGHQPAAGSCRQGIDPGKVPSRFLLIGSERSGSTMLRLMLDHHPRLACMYESDFMVRHYAACRSAPPQRFREQVGDDWHFANSGLEWPDNAAGYEDVVASFFRQRATRDGKAIVGATIHHDFANLPPLFPDGKYVHLIRDGRPVAASIVRMGWAGNTYFAARQWADTIREIQGLQAQVPSQRWFELHFEELVADPPRQLADLCSFLGVPFDEAMLRYDERSTYEPPDPEIATRWRKLDRRGIELAEMGCGALLDELGYERMFPPASPGVLQRALLQMGNRVGRTRFRCKRFGIGLLLSRKLWGLIGVRRARIEQRIRAIQEAHIK
jgi:hypothetical protein